MAEVLRQRAEVPLSSIIPREGCLPASGFYVPHFKHKQGGVR